MYLPLYVKTNYSLLESLITIDDYIEFAKTNNLNMLALTDSTMFGARNGGGSSSVCCISYL